MINNFELEHGDIRVVELTIEGNNKTIGGRAEMLFDAEKKFGIESDNESERLDMYVSINPFTNEVGMTLAVRNEDGGEYFPTHDSSPTESEKEVIREAIVEAVRKEYYSEADDEYALKGFVRRATFPYADVDVIIHRGDGNFVEFYYNPDSNSEGQVVENYYYSWDVKEAYKLAKESTATEEEMASDFFDTLQGICTQYCDDVDTPHFDDWEVEFASEFEGWGEVRDYKPNAETLRWVLERTNIEEGN